MSETDEITRKADELKQQAEHEPDTRIRGRLTRMAVRYLRIARSKAWAREHPASPSTLMDVFAKRD